MKVLLIRAEGGDIRQTVAAAPLPVGRGPRNAVILADPTVSWHHAIVWVEPDGAGAETLRVRDLRSSNGTFVNDVRVDQEVTLADGDHLRFGSVTMRVEPAPPPTEPARRTFRLEDTQAGVSWPLTRDRFRIGPGADVDLEASDGALLLVLVDEVRLVRDGDPELEHDEPIAVDRPFAVGSRTLCLREAAAPHVPTVSEQPTGFPYRLEVSLDGPLGPRAVLTHLRTEARFQVDSGNRAILLWFLARRFSEHDAAEEDRGWCEDGEVQSALWGRAGDANKLDVLLHRLRSDLRKAGFDPWFVEKRNRHLRARVAEVRVLDGA